MKTDGVKVAEETGGTGVLAGKEVLVLGQKVTNNSRYGFALLYTDCAVVPAAHVHVAESLQ